MSGLRRAMLEAVLIAVIAIGWTGVGVGHHAAGHSGAAIERLPVIGPAPGFDLRDQNGARLALEDLRGKVVVITFLYATCTDTCPLLTAKLAELGPRLGRALGRQIVFVAITVDPQRDGPEALKRYARAHGVERPGWVFLTGKPEEVRDVARRYGIYYRKQTGGDIDHTFLTSLVDREGALRVQYMGVRFDPDELHRDLDRLMAEPIRR